MGRDGLSSTAIGTGSKVTPGKGSVLLMLLLNAGGEARRGRPPNPRYFFAAPTAKHADCAAYSQLGRDERGGPRSTSLKVLETGGPLRAFRCPHRVKPGPATRAATAAGQDHRRREPAAMDFIANANGPLIRAVADTEAAQSPGRRHRKACSSSGPMTWQQVAGGQCAAGRLQVDAATTYRATSLGSALRALQVRAATCVLTVGVFACASRPPTLSLLLLIHTFTCWPPGVTRVSDRARYFKTVSATHQRPWSTRSKLDDSATIPGCGGRDRDAAGAAPHERGGANRCCSC